MNISLLDIECIYETKKISRRGVSPVIATLLLVAVAFVGGSIVFVFAQGFISETQISGISQPEHLEIIGYDARDVSPLQAHDGLEIFPANCCGVSDNTKDPDERIAIYVQSHSANPITILELRFGGTVYNYSSADKLGNWKADPVGPQQGEYVIMTGNDGKPNGDILQQSSPRIESGGIVTLVLDLEKTIPLQRDVQVSLTTTNGNIFVSTLYSGQIRE